MRISFQFLAVLVAVTLLAPARAQACPTCSVDGTSNGQVVMLVILLLAPVLAGLIGVAAIRRILRRINP